MNPITMRSILINQNNIMKRYLHISTVLNKVQSARYRPKAKVVQSLTYEMANPPEYIVARKSWNSWNTSNVKDGNRPSETVIEDIFIRNFIEGTWHRLFISEIIIKRQHNIIRIAGIVLRKISPIKMHFLLGYSEQFLSYWLHCPVKMEIVTTANKDDVIYKII
ncbi:28S ribosomal protein S24, mitochondrial isoform X1 [Apis laboriosa]|uniref:28S ribosomal protein S24, mitochondrial isoform X1 n=1 Tax=Apis laboriosa TaxID=183418 RepID=UPI001CC75A22|nr:28S ribosomal protein S24, mitochondrial isoform X1 [Apis laboriosa]